MLHSQILRGVNSEKELDEADYHEVLERHPNGRIKTQIIRSMGY